MGIRYFFDKEKGIGYSCWSGTVTAGELLEQTRRKVVNPDWPPSSRRVLADLRYATVGAGFDRELVGQIVKLYMEHAETVQNLRAAIVANGLFERAKLFEQLVSGYSPAVIVFNNLDTACVWLGIDVQAAVERLKRMREEEEMRDRG